MTGKPKTLSSYTVNRTTNPRSLVAGKTYCEVGMRTCTNSLHCCSPFWTHSPLLTWTEWQIAGQVDELQPHYIGEATYRVHKLPTLSFLVHISRTYYTTQLRSETFSFLDTHFIATLLISGSFQKINRAVACMQDAHYAARLICDRKTMAHARTHTHTGKILWHDVNTLRTGDADLRF